MQSLTGNAVGCNASLRLVRMVMYNSKHSNRRSCCYHLLKVCVFVILLEGSNLWKLHERKWSLVLRHFEEASGSGRRPLVGRPFTRPVFRLRSSEPASPSLCVSLTYCARFSGQIAQPLNKGCNILDVVHRCCWLFAHLMADSCSSLVFLCFSGPSNKKLNLLSAQFQPRGVEFNICV